MGHTFESCRGHYKNTELAKLSEFFADTVFLTARLLAHTFEVSIMLHLPNNGKRSNTLFPESLETTSSETNISKENKTRRFYDHF